MISSENLLFVSAVEFLKANFPNERLTKFDDTFYIRAVKICDTFIGSDALLQGDTSVLLLVRSVLTIPRSQCVEFGVGADLAGLRAGAANRPQTGKRPSQY